MRVLPTLLLLVTLFSSFAVANDGDDTLKFYLSKSPLVVQGKFADEPRAFFGEVGVPNYICKFTITDVLHGDHKLKGETLKLNIVRFENEEKDEHPLIRKDAECVLFLKPTINTPSWETADVWFGVQHSSPTLTKALADLSAELKAKALK